VAIRWPSGGHPVAAPRGWWPAPRPASPRPATSNSANQPASRIAEASCSLSSRWAIVSPAVSSPGRTRRGRRTRNAGPWVTAWRGDRGRDPGMSGARGAELGGPRTRSGSPPSGSVGASSTPASASFAVRGTHSTARRPSVPRRRRPAWTARGVVDRPGPARSPPFAARRSSASTAERAPHRRAGVGRRPLGVSFLVWYRHHRTTAR
jgi:hypothetical protein